MAENYIGAAIWNWSFNRITSNVWRCWRKMMHNAARVDKTVFIMVIGGIVGAQVVIFGIGTASKAKNGSFVWH